MDFTQAVLPCIAPHALPVHMGMEMIELVVLHTAKTAMPANLRINRAQMVSQAADIALQEGFRTRQGRAIARIARQANTVPS